MINTTKINGLKIYGFKSKQELIDFIYGKKVILISAAAESIMKKDNKFNDIADRHIAFPDGIGSVMALKQKNIRASKIPGAELWLDILKINLNKKIFLLGSTKSVIEKTANKLKLEYPQLNIVGVFNGYFNDEEYTIIKKQIKETKPDIVFLTLGQPKQEYIADELFQLYPTLYMGLGGSFDIYCGNKRRAPKLFLNLHLEWFYRLLNEPTRLGRQLCLVKFFILLKLGKL